MASCLAQNPLGRSLKYMLINSWLGSCPAHPNSDACVRSGRPYLECLVTTWEIPPPNITPFFWSGNQFQCYSHHTPLPTIHPLSDNNIGPPFPLAIRVIMIFPLILGYKYMRLRKGRRLLKVWEESLEPRIIVVKSERERIQRFEGCCWVSKIGSPKVGNPKPTL